MTEKGTIRDSSFFRITEMDGQLKNRVLKAIENTYECLIDLYRFYNIETEFESDEDRDWAFDDMVGMMTERVKIFEAEFSKARIVNSERLPKQLSLALEIREGS